MQIQPTPCTLYSLPYPNTPKTPGLYTDTRDPAHILKISTLALSKSLWPIIDLEFLSSSVIVAARTVNFAYVPAPLRLDRKPGLTTRTLSTTCADLSGIMQLKRARNVPLQTAVGRWG